MKYTYIKLVPDKLCCEPLAEYRCVHEIIHVHISTCRVLPFRPSIGLS